MKKFIIAAFLIASASIAGCWDSGTVSPAQNDGAFMEQNSGETSPSATADHESALKAEGAEKNSSGTMPASADVKQSPAAENEAGVNIIPPAPAGLCVEDCGSSALTLRWQESPGAEGYSIYRAASPAGPYVKLNSSAVSAAVFTDEALSESTLYCYKVSAVNAEGESPLSAAVSQRTANSSMAYVRFCNLGSVNIAGMRLGRSWFRPVSIGETTSYVEALPGAYFLEYWNAETLEWEAVSTGMFTLQAGRRYTVRDTDAAAYLDTDDVLKPSDASVFIESMSSSKNAASPVHVSK